MTRDINIGNITEALNNKVDLPADVPQDMIDYVVAMQRPTAENNWTWYRKYKSGWVEQGGIINAVSVADGTGTAGNNTIQLLIEMSDTKYWYSANTQVGGSGWDYTNGVLLNARSTTQIIFKVVAGTGTVGLYWEVKGFAAE